MASLKRTRAGSFVIDRSHTVSELEEMSEEQRAELLLPAESLFAELPEVKLSPFFERLSRNGCEVYQKKIGSSFDIHDRVRLCDESGHFYALGEVLEYNSGSAIKAIKMFDI